MSSKAKFKPAAPSSSKSTPYKGVQSEPQSIFKEIRDVVLGGDDPFEERLAKAMQIKPQQMANLIVSTRPLERQDLDDIEVAIGKGSFIAVHEGMLDFVLSSKIAFTGSVSKNDLLSLILESIQKPDVVGLYAERFLGKSTVHLQADPGSEKSKEDAALRIFCLGGAENSGTSYERGPWAKKPLTPDELRAIPYLVGFLPNAYALYDHSFESLREQVAEKFKAAGREFDAKTILSQGGIELKRVAKPRRIDDHSSPSP